MSLRQTVLLDETPVPVKRKVKKKVAKKKATKK